MGIRYIQAAITEEDYDAFTRFAGSNRLTMNDLIEVAVKEFITTNRKEGIAVSKTVRIDDCPGTCNTKTT